MIRNRKHGPRAVVFVFLFLNGVSAISYGGKGDESVENLSAEDEVSLRRSPSSARPPRPARVGRASLRSQDPVQAQVEAPNLPPASAPIAISGSLIHRPRELSCSTDAGCMPRSHSPVTPRTLKARTAASQAHGFSILAEVKKGGETSQGRRRGNSVLLIRQQDFHRVVRSDSVGEVDRLAGFAKAPESPRDLRKDSPRGPKESPRTLSIDGDSSSSDEDISELKSDSAIDGSTKSVSIHAPRDDTGYLASTEEQAEGATEQTVTPREFEEDEESRSSFEVQARTPKGRDRKTKSTCKKCRSVFWTRNDQELKKECEKCGAPLNLLVEQKRISFLGRRKDEIGKIQKQLSEEWSELHGRKATNSIFRAPLLMGGELAFVQFIQDRTRLAQAVEEFFVPFKNMRPCNFTNQLVDLGEIEVQKQTDMCEQAILVFLSQIEKVIGKSVDPEAKMLMASTQTLLVPYQGRELGETPQGLIRNVFFHRIVHPIFMQKANEWENPELMKNAGRMVQVLAKVISQKPFESKSPYASLNPFIMAVARMAIERRENSIQSEESTATEVIERAKQAEELLHSIDVQLHS